MPTTDQQQLLLVAKLTLRFSCIWAKDVFEYFSAFSLWLLNTLTVSEEALWKVHLLLFVAAVEERGSSWHILHLVSASVSKEKGQRRWYEHHSNPQGPSPHLKAHTHTPVMLRTWQKEIIGHKHGAYHRAHLGTKDRHVFKTISTSC